MSTRASPTGAKSAGASSASPLKKTVRPQVRSLRFVQIDEFYPIDPRHPNSFHAYVNHYYIRGFRLDPEKALLIDCSAIGLDES